LWIGRRLYNFINKFEEKHFMKKILAILILITLVFIIGGLFLINKHIQPLWGNDSLEVKVILPANIDSVKIEYGFNSINRKTDKELFDDRNRYILLFDGYEKNNIKTDYGENDFLITYKGYYFSFRQFKTWNKAVHSYLFKISEQNNQPYLEVLIEGENGMSFIRPMLKISDAEEYRCNTPIDSVGVIYNMIELVDK